MKWVFYLLALANAVFFAWQMRHPSPRHTAAAPAPVPVSMPGHVNRLLLLSELPPGTLRERHGTPEALPGTHESAAAGSTRAVPAATQTGAGKPPAAASAPAAAAAASALPPHLCFSAGPLDDAASVERMREWLASHGGDAQLHRDERREVPLYWVYFPPLPSRAAAQDRVEHMRGEGIADIIVMPHGDMQNAISLGVYSHRESLDRRLTELRAKGYDPSVATRYKAAVASWFDVKFPPGFHFDAQRFARRFPRAELQPVTCVAAPGGGTKQAPAGSAGTAASSAGESGDGARTGAAAPPAPPAQAASGATASPAPGAEPAATQAGGVPRTPATPPAQSATP